MLVLTETYLGYGELPDFPFVDRLPTIPSREHHRQLLDRWLKDAEGRPVWVTLPSDPNIEPVRGLQEPLVDQETFDRVQAVLHGRKPQKTPSEVQSCVPTTTLRAMRSLWHASDWCLLW
jgi:hypothetical protein